MDKFGDHFFKCKENGKKELHNRIRDAVFTICKEIFPIISDSSKSDVHQEQTRIFKKATQMRPGDVFIKHPLNSASEPHKTTAI